MFDSERYSKMVYNRCGESGLKLPAISLGLWQNFGTYGDYGEMVKIARAAFDMGVTHFDLANNYGPVPGSAEENFGRILKEEFSSHRDELIISTKAGYYMWPGPYGEWGSRKYLTASLDASLKRMGLCYVDIFYSHRFDGETPLEETIGALYKAVHDGKALYAGISNYDAEQTRRAKKIADELKLPLIVNQPRFNLLEREPEREGLLKTLKELKMGAVVYSPLAQGRLTDRYKKGIPSDSRAAKVWKEEGEKYINSVGEERMNKLNEIALSRGQTIAQTALSWALCNGKITSAIVGASKLEQLKENVGAVYNLKFTEDELAEIDKYF